jgi:hypothetical protein
MGGSSLNISSHSSRHSSQIRLTPADAIAATWSRRLPQKLHCSAPASSLTIWIVAIGVGADRPGSAITACARLTQPSQMYAYGPAINFSTCFWLCPQNEQNRRFPESGTHPLYPGSCSRHSASRRRMRPKREAGRCSRRAAPRALLHDVSAGGAKGIRTPDPLHARQVRYHCAIAPGTRDQGTSGSRWTWKTLS